MATLKLLIFAAVCVCTYAALEVPPKTTIFSDERLEGEVFEKEYIFEEPGARNTLSPSDYRLPTTTRPTDYTILWDINIANLTFSGTVEINLVATQANVNEIVLHADDLNIESVVLQQGITIVPQRFELQTDTHFMRYPGAGGSNKTRYALAEKSLGAHFDPVPHQEKVHDFTCRSEGVNAINPVVYKLTISFSADMREDMYGIYKSWFVNDPSSTTVSWMASTQFQATSARQAFPCYDEPSFKATFDITIRRPANYKSWSCTLQRETRNTTNPLYEEDVYHTTPVMSTYLLALIVAEYTALEHIVDGTLKYEVIARPSAIAQGQGQYAFDVGQLLLANMSEHAGIDFYAQHPYLKMTQASIPDFGAGAMENWGLLTYREAYLMYDPNHTNDYYKQLIAYILSHEIAHMWFGNWVTNEWWDVLWLNEGFARYYQYFLTHWVERDMGFETRFIIEQVHTALLADSANNPHPLTNPNVGSTASVSAMFSTISYNKGAAIIRMTEHFLGFDVHRQGLRNYLVNRALDVALPIHLFQELQDVAVATGAIAQYGSQFSFIDYYRTWTEQAGHPVLNVYVNHTTGQMTITQRRFNINTGYTAINNLWIIPISFATASNPDFANTKPSHILSQAVTVINRGSTGDQWVIFNKQQTGYYRVNYDAYTWDLIAIALRGPNRTQIHEYNRAQIVNDVFQFARSGLMNYTRAFNILSFLEQETAYAPWVAAMTGFTWLRNRFAGTALLTNLQTLIFRWSARVMSELTYYPRPNDTFMDSYLRWNLAPILCQMNVAECRLAANAQFQALRVNGTEVTVNSRNWVYCNGLREGTTEDFEFLFERFRLHPVYTEKIQILSILGCSPHAESINRFMDAIVTNNFLIRPQDYTSSLNSAVNGNEENTQLVFNYIKANLANVTAAFGSAARALNAVSARLRTNSEIFEFQTWVNESRVQLGDEYQSIYNNAESTRAGLLWATQVQDDIANYLDSGDEVLTSSTPPTVVVTNPTTVARPEIFEPVTPDFSSSAVTSILSFTSLIIAFIANFVV